MSAPGSFADIRIALADVRSTLDIVAQTTEVSFGPHERTHAPQQNHIRWLLDHLVGAPDQANFECLGGPLAANGSRYGLCLRRTSRSTKTAWYAGLSLRLLRSLKLPTGKAAQNPPDTAASELDRQEFRGGGPVTATAIWPRSVREPK
jgi:hypothetical protein